ncbi:EamA family transporter [Nostoc muscorum FACHB-395]|nr:EamA family transporter [Desmonostoc muscorum FACHB-395]
MNIHSTKKSRKTISTALYTLLALLFCFIWAATFIAVKFGLRSSPPLSLMFFRFLLAGCTLMLFAKICGYQLPNSKQEWSRLIVLGLLNNFAYIGLTAIALRHLSSGMGAIIASTNPIILALLAPIFLKEKLTLMKGIGLILAFVSVFITMYSRQGIDNDPISMALLLLANAFLVTGTILFKRWTLHYDLTVINGTQLLIASIALLPLILIWEPIASIRYDLNLLGAVAYLSFGVSCGGMMIWLFLLRSGDASKASAFFFLTPVIGLFLSAFLLGEPLRILDFFGATGVALGIYLVQHSKSSIIE